MKNSKLTKVLISFGLLIIVLGQTPVLAINRLNDINIQKAGDSVVVIITTTEPCEYNPFMTGTKPERIVVDLTGVVNSWARKKFMQLPLESIDAVRTSQFSAKPKLVTRVVLDIGRAIDFRSFQNGSDIVIKLPAVPGEKDFAAWNAKKAGPGTSRALATKTVKKTKPRAKPKKTAAGLEIESYPKRKIVSYKTSAYRDPFDPLIGGPGGQLGRGLPALENLSLVGILQDDEGNRALLEDAEGNGYIMMVRDRIKNGYLVSVSDRKAIYQITEYGWTRTIALELDVPVVK